MIEELMGYRLPERVAQELADATTIHEIEDATLRFLNDIGFDKATYHLVRCEPHGEQLEAFFSNYDRRWIQRYIERGYLNDDLVQRVGRQTVIPFAWLPRDKTRIPKQSAQVFSEAHDFGIRDGIGVPVHGMGRYALFTAVAAGTPEERRRTIEYAREAVTTLALHIHEHAGRLIAAHGPDNIYNGPKLTERERECLRWVMAGKTSGEIGTILGISEGTVAQHIASVRSKLNTSTRTHAAVRASQLGLIDCD